MRWCDQYHVGEVVEARFYYAEGPRWEKAEIVRKTATGLPVVRLKNRPWSISVNLARDIRKPARNLEANVY